MLIDAKRGDIGSTVAAYAETYFGASSPYNVDAITVSPYLGIEALKPIFDKAAQSGAGVFVVVRSSNHEGAVLQNARIHDGRTVADWLADSITEYNRGFQDEIGPVGAVIGATLGQESA